MADTRLLDEARQGCPDAVGELWRRHHPTAVRLARRIAEHSDVDDVASESFAKMLRALQQGGGPAHDVVSYLTTAVYRVALELDRRRMLDAKHLPAERTDRWSIADDRLLLVRALAQLPPRWRWVLWRTEVEGAKPRDLADELGLQPNAVSALRHRARIGLREAWLTVHVGQPREPDCLRVRSRLVRHTEGALPRRVRESVIAHLRTCRLCTAALSEIERARAEMMPDAAG